MWGDCIENDIATLRCIPVILSNIINALLFLSGAAAIFFVIIGGIKYLLSGGDQVKTAQARRTITFALLGLVIVIISFLILKTIALVTGADCITIGTFDSCK